MKVRVLSPVKIGGVRRMPGEEITIGDETAAALVEGGEVEAMADAPVEEGAESAESAAGEPHLPAPPKPRKGHQK